MDVLEGVEGRGVGGEEAGAGEAGACGTVMKQQHVFQDVFGGAAQAWIFLGGACVT